MWNYAFDEDETVLLVEKDEAVAKPSATDIPHHYCSCHRSVYLFRLWGAMSGPLRIVGQQGDASAKLLLQVEESHEVLVAWGLQLLLPQDGGVVDCCQTGQSQIIM